jgi:nitrite reductase/ring-hydroxylating ferredoxin subunit
LRVDGAAPARSLTPIAVYRRDIAASLDRIWENVLDWEHLPWLHSASFAGVHLLEERPDGWRAEVRLQPASAPHEAEIDVRIDRAARRYVSATVGGFGAGSEIVTGLEPIDASTTAIEVAFHVPGVDAAHRDLVGEAYVELYRRLWDEDETMMVRRQAVLDWRRRQRSEPAVSRGVGATAAVAIGIEGDVRARLPLVVSFSGRDIRLVDLSGEIVAHAATCPHRGGPLVDAALDGGCVTCPWHGYRFDVRSGASAEGRPYRLDRAPRVAIDARTRMVTLEPE